MKRYATELKSIEGLNRRLYSDLSDGIVRKREITGIEGKARPCKGGGTWRSIVNTGPGKYVNPFVGHPGQR